MDEKCSEQSELKLCRHFEILHWRSILFEFAFVSNVELNYCLAKRRIPFVIIKKDTNDFFFIVLSIKSWTVLQLSRKIRFPFPTNSADSLIFLRLQHLLKIRKVINESFSRWVITLRRIYGVYKVLSYPYFFASFHEIKSQELMHSRFKINILEYNKKYYENNVCCQLADLTNFVKRLRFWALIISQLICSQT